MTTVTGLVRNLRSTSAPGSQLRWKYLSAPAIVGGALVSSFQDILSLCGPTGAFSQALTGGNYQLSIDGNDSDKWIVAVPSDNLSYDVGALIISSVNTIPAAPTPVVTVLQWAVSEGYELTAINYDADGVITTAAVKWADGSVGVFTTTLKNTTFFTTDAYTITHSDSGRTVTQAAVTRNGNGLITVNPPLTIA